MRVLSGETMGEVGEGCSDLAREVRTDSIRLNVASLASLTLCSQRVNTCAR